MEYLALDESQPKNVKIVTSQLLFYLEGIHAAGKASSIFFFSDVLKKAQEKYFNE